MPKTNSEDDFGGSITSDDSDVDAGPSSPVAGTGQGSKMSAPRENLNIDTYVNPTSTHPIRSSPVSPIRFIPSSRSTHVPTMNVNVNGESAPSPLRGVALFRASARKIMQMRQMSALMGGFRGAGAEPGIDPSRASAFASYGHIKEKCAIQVIDYSALRSKFHTFDNKGFTDFLAQKGSTKEAWAKVRWIFIGGISWDVISTLSLAYIESRRPDACVQI